MSAGGNNGDTVPEFIWFGRERDMPPDANVIYVDHLNNTGYEIGTSDHPFNTAEEGEFALQPGDDLMIRTGTYNEELIFDTQSEVDNFDGTSIIVAGGPEANAEARLRASEDGQQAVDDTAADGEQAGDNVDENEAK